MSNVATVSYVWAKRGVQPKVLQQQRVKERRTLFGCVEPATGKTLTSVTLKGNTLTFFCFLLKITQFYPNQKVYVVLDNVRFHHAKRLNNILLRYRHRIELIFLPPYSPNLNPMERVWWYMRKKITHNRCILSMNERINRFNELFKPLENTNELCKNLSKLCINI